MTSQTMTSSILKINLFIPALENQLRSKFDSSVTFGLAVGQ